MHRSPEVTVIDRNHYMDVRIGIFQNFHFNLIFFGFHLDFVGLLFGQ